MVVVSALVLAVLDTDADPVSVRVAVIVLEAVLLPVYVLVSVPDFVLDGDDVVVLDSVEERVTVDDINAVVVPMAEYVDVYESCADRVLIPVRVAVRVVVAVNVGNTSESREYAVAERSNKSSHLILSGSAIFL